MKQKLVLVGNGMAGMKVIEELLTLAPEQYEITVFGAEPYGNYNRIMLSPLLAGEQTVDDIMLNTPAWYEQNEIVLHAGKQIVELDRRGRQVIAADGTRARYDRLLLATGSTPFILPIPGNDLPGVVGYRDIPDVERMLEASRQYKRAVVIGGGLLGLEAAYGLAKQGMAVTVVHLMDTLMERQLDAPAGNMLQRSLEARGLRFRMAAQTQELVGDERVEAVRFTDGSEEPADLVVMAAGIRPNIALAQQAGLHCERGVVVSDTLQTFDPRIYAVGECAQHRGQCYGLVAPLFEQAKVCANHLAGLGFSRYQGSVTSTKLKVTGIELFSAGDFHGDADCDEVVYRDPSAGIYKRIVIRDDKILGCVLYGDTSDGSWYFQLMREGTSIADFREALLFGQPALHEARDHQDLPAAVHATRHSPATPPTEQADEVAPVPVIEHASESPDDVKEYCAAFMQLYREEAHHLERTARWMERVGVAHITRRIVKDEVGRRALARRFLAAEEHLPPDSGADYALFPESAEFAPRQEAVR